MNARQQRLQAETIVQSGPEIFYCEVGLKDGGFQSRLEVRLDATEAEHKAFIEGWLLLMGTALKAAASRKIT